MTAGATGRGIIDPVLLLWPMAYKKSKGKQRMSKIEPSPLTMMFNVPLTSQDTVGTYFIDLSQVASLVNRRFYRQGINWAVAGFKVIAPSREPGTGAVTSQVLLSKLPNTWVLSNSWEKSMRTWMKMNNEALAETESVRPRFLDFKIYADADHHARGFSTNLIPSSLGSASGFANVDYLLGEWESSKVVMPDFDTLADQPGRYSREVIAVGGSYPGPGASGFDAVSMIEGYASSRSLPNVVDPNTPSDVSDIDGLTPENWMAAIFNDGQITDSAIVEDLTTENNSAPYPFENGPDQNNPISPFPDTMYPGGANQASGMAIHDIDTITATTIGGMARLKGGNFPCGLIRLDHVVPSYSVSHGLTLLIDLIPGSHRGYLCEPMTEM